MLCTSAQGPAAAAAPCHPGGDDHEHQGDPAEAQRGDAAKYTALMALNPLKMVTYTATNLIPPPIEVAETADYLLVTGGHGDFLASAPTKFDDLPVAMAKPWISSLKGEFEAIILDTCFSSAFAPSFVGHLPMGGHVVCAHGSGEGRAGGFDAGKPNETEGDVLAEVVGNMDGMGLGYSSISLLQRSSQGMRLYTANTGHARTSGLSARGNMGTTRPSSPSSTAILPASTSSCSRSPTTRSKPACGRR
jgi:hypothetical protein